jgi:hypothetical protein
MPHVYLDKYSWLVNTLFYVYCMGKCNIRQRIVIILHCGSLLVACHIHSECSVVVILDGLSTQTNLQPIMGPLSVMPSSPYHVS